MSNGTAKCRMEQPNVEWNSEMSNRTAKCRMEQPNVEWNSQMSNGTAKCRMEQGKCRMEQPNVEWNSQESNGISCSHRDDHDVNPETDLARNRARALQPFHSLFLQSRSTCQLALLLFFASTVVGKVAHIKIRGFVRNFVVKYL